MSLHIVMDRMGFPLEVLESVKHSIPVTESILAKTGFLDSFWTAGDNHPITLERKTVYDFTHRINDLELQLKRALQKVEDTGEVILLIEGIMEPVNGSTVLYKQKKDGSLFFRDRVVNRPYAFYMNWIYSVMKQGIDVFWTPTPKATAALLVSLVKESNKADFQTFKRYIRPHSVIPQLDRRVQILHNMGLGVEKAKTLIAHCGSIWNILHTEEEELLKLPGIGQKTIDEFFREIKQTK